MPIIKLSLVMLNTFMYYFTPPPPPPIFILLTSSPVVSMYFQSEWKTVWILISWLHQKPVDLDLQCFHIQIKLGIGFSRTRVKNIENGNYTMR